jgi:hypothetical protein
MKPPGDDRDRVRDRVKNKDNVAGGTIVVDRQIHHVNKIHFVSAGRISIDVSP